MIAYPKFDPIAVHIPLDFSIGSFHFHFEGIHWYGLMYLLGFALFLLLGRVRLRSMNRPGWDSRMLDDLLFYSMVGLIVGARLGDVFFYRPEYYWEQPAKIIALWEGGMSFHGGFLGVMLAVTLFTRKWKLVWLELTDFIAPLAPLGLGAGRIGNFINGELWGRVIEKGADVPWGMVFRGAGPLPRHPSQLYQFAGEGVLLFVILWLYSAKPRPVGAVSAMFLIGYGVMRFAAEFFREPDDFLGLLAFNLSMGQWLSLPMIVAGIAMLAWAGRKV
jgi:phosphatidylglycerol:prolipoprotein diacylglycerol transferase